MLPCSTTSAECIIHDLVAHVLKRGYTKTSFCIFSHRSRDDERASKPASTPAKLAEEVPLPKPKESGGREEKQLPPLPGQM